jgi:hypothetical protein
MWSTEFAPSQKPLPSLHHALCYYFGYTSYTMINDISHYYWPASCMLNTITCSITVSILPLTQFRFPGPIINIITWAPLHISTYPKSNGCLVNFPPPSWGTLPFLFQSVFDLLVFVLCLIKVSFTPLWQMPRDKCTFLLIIIQLATG